MRAAGWGGTRCPRGAGCAEGREARVWALHTFPRFSVCPVMTMVCCPLCPLRWESRCFQVWSLSGEPFQHQEVAAEPLTCPHRIPQLRFLWAWHQEALGSSDTPRTPVYSHAFPRTLAHTCSLTHSCTSTHIYSHTLPYAHTHKGLTNLHMLTFTYTHPCTYSHLHTHTPTHILTHTFPPSWSS